MERFEMATGEVMLTYVSEGRIELIELARQPRAGPQGLDWTFARMSPPSRGRELQEESATSKKSYEGD